MTLNIHHKANQYCECLQIESLFWLSKFHIELFEVFQLRFCKPRLSSERIKNFTFDEQKLITAVHN